ncbi:MAG TPA: ABC transporter ATP-binding protein [Bacteroidales bacterium]|nr:ABC transporter ATP-binding protein [Bacteroidales bacterium]
MADDKKGFRFGTFVRLIAQAAPYRIIFILAGVLAVLLAPVGVLRPYLINHMVDNQIIQSDYDGLIFMTGLLFVILFVEAFMRYGFIYSTNFLGQSIIRDLRKRVFNHLVRLKLNYFDRTPIGQSTTRTINDIETINQTFSQGVITIVADVLSIFAVLGIMFYTSWQLTLVVLTTLPVLWIGTYYFKEGVKISYQRVRNQISKMNSFLQERISGMRVVQIFNAEEQEAEKFKTINRDYTEANLKSIFYYALFFPFVEIVSAAALGLLVWYGAKSVLQEDITLGVLVAFPIYINMLFRPMRMLADRFNTLQMGLVAAHRVFNVLDNDEMITDAGQIEKENIEGKIEFDHVYFSYDDENLILKDIDFTVEPGETLAIVGSTGSGKTTIINLINRFYDVNKGRISIDGDPIQKYKLNNLRRHLAIVLQDVFLFSGTLFDNISLKDPSITKEEVIEASKLIGAHEFFDDLPDKYDFWISERGNNLSMGQRQLISFVRALIFKPNILILDEATSSIDTETEAIIQHAIETLIKKRTSIIIAHRLSTIRHADKILVLHQGRIKEFGSPEELLQIENGWYKDLYENQFLSKAKASA